MTKQEWKTYLKDIGYIDLSIEPEERTIRKAISELRKEGVIFVPNGSSAYFNVDRINVEQARQFAKAQKRAWLTQYVNTVRPLEKFMDEQDKIELYGVLV